ncbi:type VI secretion system baseplate subunit TssG [Serratia aquatilis]|uniref:Type VI secretion system baseplate subunit TssG n=1 Tax=Serratia aquatilis TaxID=1737515 RepID=A0ABV6EHL1_9GAMM
MIPSAEQEQQLQVIAENVSKYEFYRLVEGLNRLAGIDPARSLGLQPNQEALRFTAAAGLGFAANDVVELQHQPGGAIRLVVSFLGLQGSQSPLPYYYLDDIAGNTAQGETRLNDFLAVFNHRPLAMAHQIWRKYRYEITFKPGGRDATSGRIFALMGLSHPQTREQLGINAEAMLAYAGLLASPGRSPDVIASLVAHFFSLTDVTVQPYQTHVMTLREDQQNRLGQVTAVRGQRHQPRSLLGSNFVIGSRMLDRSVKFQLSINALSQEQYLSFLPDGAQHHLLVNFVEYVLREPLVWDLRLTLDRHQAGGMRLGDKHRTQLGWTTFLGQPDEKPYTLLPVRR